MRMTKYFSSVTKFNLKRMHYTTALQHYPELFINKNTFTFIYTGLKTLCHGMDFKFSSLHSPTDFNKILTSQPQD